MTPEHFAAAGARRIVVTDLHRHPLLRTDVTLERATTALGAFFFHDSLPVPRLETSLQDRERLEPGLPSTNRMVPDDPFQYQ